MSVFRFVPNEFAKEAFNLAADAYEGPKGRDLLLNLLENVYAEKANAHLIAQDYFFQNKTSGVVRIMLNPDEPDERRHSFATISMIHKL